MKIYIALLMCLILSGCGRCWYEVCTLSCEQHAEQRDIDPSYCSADTHQGDTHVVLDTHLEQSDVVEIGDVTVEDTTNDVVEDTETEESVDASDVAETSDL